MKFQARLFFNITETSLNFLSFIILSAVLSIAYARVTERETEEFRDCMIGYLQSRNIFVTDSPRMGYPAVCDEKLVSFMKELTEVAGKSGKINAECSYATIEKLRAKVFIYQLFVINSAKELSKDDKLEIFKDTNLGVVNRLIQHFIYFSCKEFDMWLAATDKTYNETELQCIHKFVADNHLIRDLKLKTRKVENYDCDTFIAETRSEVEVPFDRDLYTNDQQKCIEIKSRVAKFFDTVTRLITLGRTALSESEKQKERRDFDDFYPRIFKNILDCLELNRA